MQIDYFTIFAQIINFLILVFLLRHFLYGPVTKLMEEREQKIVSRLQEVEKKKREAEQELESYRKMSQELSNKREEMLAEAAREAQVLEADLMKKAREEVSASSANWYRDLQAQEGNTARRSEPACWHRRYSLSFAALFKISPMRIWNARS